MRLSFVTEQQCRQVKDMPIGLPFVINPHDPSILYWRTELFSAAVSACAVCGLNISGSLEADSLHAHQDAYLVTIETMTIEKVRLKI